MIDPPLWKPSRHYDSRPAGSGPSLVVLHSTEGASVVQDLRWLDESRMSYHYIVGRSGTMYQLVEEKGRAWHAGESRWLGRLHVNDFSIGVALSNAGPHEPYTDKQLDAAAWLVADILKRRGLDASHLVAHSDVATPHGRRTDPGEHFPWAAFRLAVIFYMHPDPQPSIVNPARLAA